MGKRGGAEAGIRVSAGEAGVEAGRGGEHGTGAEKGGKAGHERGRGAEARTGEVGGGAEAETSIEGAGARTGGRRGVDPEEEGIEEETEAEIEEWKPDLALHPGEVPGVLSRQSEAWGMCTASFTSVTSDPPPLTCPSLQRKGTQGPSSACS